MIEPKKKACKGIGRALGFQGCGQLTLYRKYGLCLGGCYAEWIYSTKEGSEVLLKTLKTVQAPRKSFEKAERKHKETSGIVSRLKYTRTQVHKAVRLRDKFKPCISCGCQWKSNFQAGHCYAAGNYKSLRFDFFNINGQCEKCNLFEGGKETDYLLMLPARIGRIQFKKLNQRATKDKKFNKHWTNTELDEINKQAKAIINEFKD